VAESVETVVATPHMAHPVYNVPRPLILERVAELRDASRRRGLGLSILPGGDVHLQPDLLPMLDSGNLMTVADGGVYLLLELPEQGLPPLADLVFQLQVRGITPVVTHPERHAPLVRRPQYLAELVERGCLAQVTAGALLGEFGRSARRAAERFLAGGLAHVVASDAHSASGPRSPSFAPVRDRLASLVGPERAAQLLCANPGRLVRGEPMEPIE